MSESVADKSTLQDRPLTWLSRFRGCLIADGRGRSVEMLDPFRLYLSGGDDVIERSVLKRIIDNIAPRRSMQLWGLVLFAGGLFVAMAGFAFIPEYLATRNGTHSLMEALRSPVIWWALGYCLLVVPWKLFAERRIRRRRITASILSARRCAHCGYDLQGHTPDADDNATVCPECAAAWKLDDEWVSRTLAADDEQARQELVRFHVRLGIIMTIAGVGMALIYLL